MAQQDRTDERVTVALTHKQVEYLRELVLRDLGAQAGHLADHARRAADATGEGRELGACDAGDGYHRHLREPGDVLDVIGWYANDLGLGVPPREEVGA